ncbi:sensor histidine kinase [Bifidobacterium samirii]|uniref:Histidine kinase-, DNA gyrase B-, and HSP90-like ATPase n=1 Tax=Bifidobacterium samirii TaxID=2306974 RepID=A0A430FRB7_9BIFI|nr:GHKL domain-containing protein [Bifidobacterium samirii]RSX55390.1 Histidine kinase-, DNA gyrase B-, and HSP90-like ATPase [Bifidobacterium samirii]
MIASIHVAATVPAVASPVPSILAAIYVVAPPLAFLYDSSTIAPLTPSTLLIVLAEHATLVPAIVLCFAIAWDLLRVPHRMVVVSTVAAVVGYLLASVWLYFFAPVSDVVGASLSLAFAAFVCLWFWHVTDLDLPRALFTSLSCAAMMAVCVFVGQMADMVANDEWRALGPYSSFAGVIAEYGLAVAAVALLWRPARTMMPRILRSPVIEPVAWRVLWLAPFGLYVLLMMYHGRQMDVMTDATAQLGVFAVTMYCALLLMLYWLLAKVDCEASRRVEAEQSARQLELGRAQVRSLTDRMAQARRSRHDLRQHMVALHGYARNDDLPGLRRYLDAMVADLGVDEPLAVCDHVVVNAVVSYYVAAVRSLGVRPDVRLDVPADLSFDATDLTVVFGNLLENALAALRGQCAQEARPAFLTVRSRTGRGGELFLTIDNSFVGGPRRDRSGHWLSSHHDGAGVGLESVRSTVERLGGEMRVDASDGIFRVSIMLPDGGRTAVAA